MHEKNIFKLIGVDQNPKRADKIRQVHSQKTQQNSQIVSGFLYMKRTSLVFTRSDKPKTTKKTNKVFSTWKDPFSVQPEKSCQNNGA